MADDIRIAFLLFPHLTQLDLTGPAQVLSRVPGARVEYAAATLDPVPSDCGLSLVPTTTMSEARAADVLVVPGGDGAFDAMLDPDVVAFVRRQAEHATWITSVCTGAFVLGAAGLLAGRRATTHWASKPMLEAFGAQPVDARIARDGAVVTAAGVSAGIDMALWLAAELAGQSAAEAIQLQIEYDPQPPFDNGSAERADAVVVTRARAAAEESRGARVTRAAAAVLR
ncbi:DJ-1/PfpI family protein [Curtobacterium flaccumfaciens]|uniref:DJ-1/PfpI family protein n=1 Tax=Curtobacterium flaccumfaciens TaxID=2035 RepID=UPI001BDF5E72|nr:DJ-1/PfpI family protein [Curtobacterium flaccumfaciens]MBT1605442.1 DJ-1/PfpI family protein [Curtobacterium flaccumfaciens pv. betae]MBT1658446.1 DJ-1/PfpI family protein [Curtobacterium flaccumfaciens pv. betae]MCS0470336.1 DJ-1/PfpI family protein [Curtobacterium flaccumfaciens pv. betae]MCS0473700.1 DJ-1/PfpI family protein [Curtobacterium flaccumfaciens pv. betae]MCS0478795.1 DJ-1/PfpI family protein [Curtobacterium flaccumfaciens pv. betae]